MCVNSQVFERVRASLLDQRQNIAAWLHNTPPQKKQIRLGPLGEQAVQTHLQVLDMALE